MLEFTMDTFEETISGILRKFTNVFKTVYEQKLTYRGLKWSIGTGSIKDRRFHRGLYYRPRWARLLWKKGPLSYFQMCLMFPSSEIRCCWARQATLLAPCPARCLLPIFALLLCTIHPTAGIDPGAIRHWWARVPDATNRTTTHLPIWPWWIDMTLLCCQRCLPH